MFPNCVLNKYSYCEGETSYTLFWSSSSSSGHLQDIETQYDLFIKLAMTQ